MKALILLLLATSALSACCWFKKKAAPKPVVVKKKQEHKEKDTKELHSFVKEVTNVDVAKQDLKTELKDVAETLVAIGINEGTKLVAKTAVEAVI